MIYVPEFENEYSISEFESALRVTEDGDRIRVEIAGETLWRPADLDVEEVSDSVIYTDGDGNPYYLNNMALYGENWILVEDEKYEIVEVVNDIDDPEYGIWAKDADGEYICFVDYEEEEEDEE